MISVSEWIELMKMLSEPNCVINAKEFEQVRSDIERLAINSYPGCGSCTSQPQGETRG